MNSNPLAKLEQYSQQHPQEVLLVKAMEAGEEKEIIIFKGFSSCLTGATEFNPDLPVLSTSAEIITIDRLQGPYNPTNPQYLQQNLTWQEFINLSQK